MNEQTRSRLNNYAGRALSTLDTIYNTYDLAERCILDGIEGDFVECGVFCGSQIAAMAQACIDYRVERTIHLFDSFEGIPEAGPNDDETITGCIGVSDGTGRLVSTGVSISTVEAVQQHMREWMIPESFLRFHKGWFQHTVPGVDISKIALLRLDGDLYESTKVCLDHLADRVSPGGWIIMDDGGVSGAVKATNEYIARLKVKPKIYKVPNSDPIYWQA